MARAQRSSDTGSGGLEPVAPPATRPRGRAARPRHHVRPRAGRAAWRARRSCWLHGWTATADINWHTSYDALARRFRVLALDHRGHGRGVQPRGLRSLRLEDWPTTSWRSADVLGLDRFVVAGYSMGGPIAKLVWRRHPDRVIGPGPVRHGPQLHLRRARGAAVVRVAERSGDGLAARPGAARRWLSDQFLAPPGPGVRAVGLRADPQPRLDGRVRGRAASWAASRR